MLSLTKIVEGLGFGAGVGKQATVVAADKVTKAAKAAYSEVSEVEYSKEFAKQKEAFNRGFAKGETFVDSKVRPLEEVLKLETPKLSLSVL